MIQKIDRHTGSETNHPASYPAQSRPILIIDNDDNKIMNIVTGAR